MADATKERIIAAAVSVLQSTGIESLTMEYTADVAGVSRKTIYNHFDTKFKLIDAVANEWMRAVFAQLESKFADTTLDFVAKLNSVIDSGFANMQQGGLMLKRKKTSSTDTRLPALHREINASLRSLTERMVSEAKEMGIVKPDFETKRLTWVLVNVIEGLLFLDELDDSPFSKAEILKDSLRAILCGILSEQGLAAMRSSTIFIKD